jgi:uncharacterized membrane protein YeaQ/YmgE (transglycosylase-associated protein family)
VIGDIDLPPSVVIGVLGAFLGDVVFENSMPLGTSLFAQIIFTAVGALTLLVLGRILLRCYSP